MGTGLRVVNVRVNRRGTGKQVATFDVLTEIGEVPVRLADFRVVIRKDGSEGVFLPSYYEGQLASGRHQFWRPVIIPSPSDEMAFCDGLLGQYRAALEDQERAASERGS